MTTVAGTYDLHLVALSFAVACLASYTALDLAGRIRASAGSARGVWLATAAISMGGGIWSMHFIAMLAFLMPMVVTFDVDLTVLSLVVAIVVTGGAFYVISIRRVTAPHLSLSGVFMGIGIVASQEGTVLLVEDNEDVATVSAGYLEQLGYTVELAMNGSEGLQKLRSGRSYDLVFSDLLMPGSVAGLELARFVRGNHPHIPILLTTGYSQKAQEAVRDGFSILRKPYDLQSLFKAICELRAKSVTQSASRLA